VAVGQFGFWVKLDHGARESEGRHDL